jgi:hypothetical protein
MGLLAKFQILETAEPNSNVVVISHRGTMDERFSRKLEFYKDKGFSQYRDFEPTDED